MSRVLMLFVALLYLGAFIASVFERKWAWAVLTLCWGVGGLVLVYMNK
jgi:fatty acid desaturase